MKKVYATLTLTAISVSANAGMTAIPNGGEECWKKVRESDICQEEKAMGVWSYEPMRACGESAGIEECANAPHYIDPREFKENYEEVQIIEE
jgi:hypothetical protein